MRYMLLVKATKDTEAGKFPEDKEKLLAAMATYHEELAKAGALLAGSGLQPSSKGWRVKYSGGRRTLIDGPFIETKEVLGGYWMIQVKSREDAIDWASRAPMPDGDVIEVRQVQEMSDFPPDVQEAAGKFQNR